MGTWTAPTVRTTGEFMLAGDWNTDLSGNMNFLKDPVTDQATIELGGQTTLTIAAGVVTAVLNVHFIDTESAAATDDLDTINFGTGLGQGLWLLLRSADNSRDPTVKHGTGNLSLAGGTDFAMPTTSYYLLLFAYTASAWAEISRTAP